jgi:translin
MEKKLKKIERKIKKILEEEDEIREKALKDLREILMDSAVSVKLIHKGDFKKAENIINDCIEKLEKIKKILKKYPEIYYQGFLHQTEKEVIEALTTLKIIKEKDIPEINSFDPISYLHGISESVGEIRRYLLDRMREGEIDDFEDYLKIMDDIYFFLLNFPYNDSITRSLRRQIDYVRAIIEKTRGEITTYYLFKKKEI